MIKEDFPEEVGRNDLNRWGEKRFFDEPEKQRGMKHDGRHKETGLAVVYGKDPASLK